MAAEISTNQTWVFPEQLEPSALPAAVCALRKRYAGHRISSAIHDEYETYIENLDIHLQKIGWKARHRISYNALFKHLGSLANIDNLDEAKNKLAEFISIETVRKTELSFDELLSLATKADTFFYRRYEQEYTVGDYHKVFASMRPSPDSEITQEQLATLWENYIKYIFIEYMIKEYQFFNEKKLLEWNTVHAYCDSVKIVFTPDGQNMLTVEEIR